jgi:hypothetical protein
VFSPFLLLPQPAGRPAPTLSHREPPRLRASAMMVSRALRPLPFLGVNALYVGFLKTARRTRITREPSVVSLKADKRLPRL